MWHHVKNSNVMLTHQGSVSNSKIRSEMMQMLYMLSLTFFVPSHDIYL